MITKKSIQKFYQKILAVSALLYLSVPGIIFASSGKYERWLCGLWAYLADVILPLSTIMIMLAGLMWTTSGGDPGKITKAREIIWGVVTGLGFLLLSFILMKYVIGIDVRLIPGKDCMWGA